MNAFPPDNTNAISPETDILLEQLRHEAKISRTLGRWLQIFLTLWGCGALPWLFASLFLPKHDPLRETLLALYGISILFTSPPSLALSFEQWRRKKRRIELIKKLSSDVRSTGPLLLFLHYKQDSGISSQVLDVLNRLLPRVQASDQQNFTNEQIEVLGALLQAVDKEASKQVILKALQQVGNEHAMKPVQKLAASYGYGPLHDLAQETLECLQIRAAEQEKASTLLRPSMATNSAPEILLRPATASQNRQDAPEQLLRPIE